jgi:glycolate oxidase FAD binding subunit
MAEPTRYSPATAAEVQQIVADAVSERRTLEVRGGGSKRLMREPIAAQALLDVSSLTGITDYDPDELVVTARAGTALAEIEAALANRQQMLAFEPFDHGPLFGLPPGRATLGGIIAANVSGPRRVSIGAARDHILGCTAVSGRGETLKAGGAVVKNVTGFDLPKLMAGSWGTLALLLSITVRVMPQPRSETTLLFGGLSDIAANRLMCAAMATPAAVSAAAHVGSTRPVTALRLEGFGPSVDARCRELLRVLAPLAAGEAIEAEESSGFWRGVRTLDALPREGHVLWRISMPPAHSWQIPSLLGSIEAQYVYDWAGALVWVALPEDAPHASGARIRTIAHSLGGNARLIRAQAAVREASALAMQSDRAPVAQGSSAPVAQGEEGLKLLHERVKAAFDPSGILNPGLDLSTEL